MSLVAAFTGVCLVNCVYKNCINLVMLHRRTSCSAIKLTGELEWFPCLCQSSPLFWIKPYHLCQGELIYGLINIFLQTKFLNSAMDYIVQHFLKEGSVFFQKWVFSPTLNYTSWTHLCYLHNQYICTETICKNISSKVQLNSRCLCSVVAFFFSY